MKKTHSKLVTKRCKMCDKEFLGNKRMVYCSASCRTKYQSEYAKRWRDKNREKYNDYMRRYAKGL